MGEADVRQEDIIDITHFRLLADQCTMPAIHFGLTVARDVLLTHHNDIWWLAVGRLGKCLQLLAYALGRIDALHVEILRGLNRTDTHHCISVEPVAHMIQKIIGCGLHRIRLADIHGRECVHKVVLLVRLLNNVANH